MITLRKKFLILVSCFSFLTIQMGEAGRSARLPFWGEEDFEKDYHRRAYPTSTSDSDLVPVFYGIVMISLIAILVYQCLTYQLPKKKRHHRR